MGGVLISDMPWDVVIYPRFDASLRPAVENIVRAEWAQARVNVHYPERQFFTAVQSAANLHPDTVEQMQLQTREHVKFFPASVALAAALKNRMPIGIVSNHTKFWFDYFFGRYHLADHFADADLVINSAEVGTAKPQQDIFKIIFERLKARMPDLQPSEVVFIDDKEANTKAATEFGMNAITYNARKQKHSHLVAELTKHGVNCELD
eukprot:TRINITY_DN2485_c0_g1_i1.p1 TRINITY_DN2485_c0_g1~~TRINITY_DN2485_c0_g1_i1.p1  ORF type:complete len:232 (-),score=52.15 TRINITY_DN2485_c0_g1_i1:406-1026(-)